MVIVPIRKTTKLLRVMHSFVINCPENTFPILFHMLEFLEAKDAISVAICVCINLQNITVFHEGDYCICAFYKYLQLNISKK